MTSDRQAVEAKPPPTITCDVCLKDFRLDGSDGQVRELFAGDYIPANCEHAQFVCDDCYDSGDSEEVDQ